MQKVIATEARRGAGPSDTVERGLKGDVLIAVKKSVGKGVGKSVVKSVGEILEVKRGVM